MPDRKIWEIDPDKPITFEAALKKEDFTEINDLIASAVRQTVLTTLEEHGYLERGEPVTFINSKDHNIIIKPPTGGKAPQK